MARKAKTLPNLEVDDVLDEVYDRNDRLLLSDYEIESEEDLRYLREIGVRYAYLMGAEGSPLEETVYEDKVTDEEPEEPVNEEPDLDPLERYELVEGTYDELVEETRQLFRELRSGNSTLDDLSGLRNLTEKLVDETMRFPSGVNLLRQLKTRDPSTYTHSANVSVFAVLYGYRQGYSRRTLIDLGLGALLHDIGKTELPREILMKSGRLNEKERELVETHPTEGYKLLRGAGCNDVVKRIVYEHHERPDGSGYPRESETLHELSVIVSIIEVHESLRADQTYRDSMGPLETHLKLHDEFANYEETQSVLRSLIRSFGIFPVGSFVKLSNDYVGLVMENNEDHPKHPVVKIVGSPNRNLEDTFEIDLRKTQEKTFAKNFEIFDADVKVEDVLDTSDRPDLTDRIPNYFKDRLRAS